MKKVLAIVLVIVSIISCFSVMAFAVPTTVLEATVDDGIVTVNVIVKDAAGLKTFDTELTYDASVLKVKGAVKDGAYKAQYEGCCESIISAYNKDTPGVIIPGIAIGNEIFDDATFATMCEDNEVEGTPVTTKNLLLFTVKFNIINDRAINTRITCGDATVLVDLGYVHGDVNGDMKISIDDARLCLRQSISLESYVKTSREFLSCDIDKDGVVEVEDARIILRTAICLDNMAPHHTWEPATCLKPKTCKTCGVIVGSVENHNWKNTKTVLPTCMAAGTKTFSCTFCGKTKAETTKATGHTFKTVTVNATYTSTGYKVDKCTTCQLEQNRVVIPVLKRTKVDKGNYYFVNGYAIKNKYYNYSNYIRVIEAKKTGKYTINVVFRDNNNNIIGTAEDYVYLEAGTTGCLEYSDYSIDEKINKNTIKIEETYSFSSSSILKAANSSFSITERNKSGEYYYVTVKQTKKTNDGFFKVQAVFLKDGVAVDYDYCYLDLNSVNSSEICKFWEYEVNYNSVDLYITGYSW